MLLSFRVSNHRSFRTEQELLLLPAYDKGRTTVPIAGIYGANASGKSNLLDALSYMRRAVLSSFSSWGPLGGVPRDPFTLATAARSEESTFAIDLIVNGDKYVYGFALDNERVADERLFHYPRGRRRVLFERDGDEFRFGDSLRGPKNTIEEVTRPNSLFLSAAAQHGLEQVLPVYAWFEKSLTLAGQFNHRERRRQTMELLRDTGSAQRIVDLLRAADLGINDVRVRQGPLTAVGSPHPIESDEDSARSSAFFGPTMEWVFVDQWRPARVALVRDTPEGPVSLPLGKESHGTQTWFDFLGLIVDALDSGGVLVVDELDTSLHPLLAREFLRLFQNPETNCEGAQLVFTTHDTSLLARHKGEEILRRDDVWFTEKIPSGETRLFPLTDFKPRTGLNWERRYLGGSVGAVPFLEPGDFAKALGARRAAHG